MTTERDSGSDSVRDVAKWVAGLEDIERSARRVLQDVGSQSLSALNSDHQFAQVASSLYKAICRGLYELLDQHWGNEKDEEMGGDGSLGGIDNFFLWPGYLRYATSKPNRLDVIQRIDIDEAIESSEELVVYLKRRVRDGIGYSSMKGQLKEISYAPLSIWMHLLYARPLGALTVHGMTRWFADAGDLKTVIGKDGHSLAGIEFDFGDGGQVVTENRVLTIPLGDCDSLSKLGDQLNKKLTDREYLKTVNGKIGRFPPIDVENDGDREQYHTLSELLMGIVFSSMYTGLQANQSSPTDEFFDLINRTKRVAHGLSLTEVSEALDLGLKASELLRGPIFQRAFRYYYAIPLPRGLRIDGFHRIDADLGTVNIYSSRRIPSLFISLLQIWLQRMYEGLRLLEIAADAEQRGLRIAAGAFQHEVKKLANALGSRWIHPAEQLFQVSGGGGRGPHNGFDARIGTISLDTEFIWLSKSLGVTPFRDVYKQMSSLLNMWSMSENVADLPFSLESSLTLVAFASRCLEVSQKALEPHALSSFSGERRETLLDFKASYEALGQLFNHQRRILNVVRSRLFLIWPNHTDSLWLGRLIIAILKNAVQHGNPLFPVRVELEALSGSRHRLTISNRRFPNDQFSYGTFVADLQDEPLKLDEETAKRVAKALNSMRKGAEELSRAASGFTVGDERRAELHSSDLIEVCASRLAGRLIPADPQDERDYVVSVEFDY